MSLTQASMSPNDNDAKNNQKEFRIECKHRQSAPAMFVWEKNGAIACSSYICNKLNTLESLSKRVFISNTNKNVSKCCFESAHSSKYVYFFFTKNAQCSLFSFGMVRISSIKSEISTISHDMYSLTVH